MLRGIFQISEKHIYRKHAECGKGEKLSLPNCKKRIFDYCEKSKRKPKTLEYVDLADESADAESLLISEECVENIKKVIAEMPTSVRDALMLHYIDGIDAKTIAEVQGKTVSAVKSEISRGTVKLLERIRCSNGYDK